MAANIFTNLQPAVSPDRYHPDDGGFVASKAVDGEPVTGTRTFNVSAQGGVRFVTGGSQVTYIEGGTAGWSNTSTRTAKTNVEPVEPETALEAVESMPVSTWEYTDEDGAGEGTRFIGPMAEEFHDAFDVGDNEKAINSINADGAAFAAIKGLAAKLEATNDTLATKDERIETLEAENAALEDRLATVENHLGIDADSTATPDDE